VVYFKDKKDIQELKARKIGDKTLFKVRGKVVLDKNTWRMHLAEARLVREE
jgi:hypothetical protein